jgi:hypothetical protein
LFIPFLAGELYLFRAEGSVVRFNPFLLPSRDIDGGAITGIDQNGGVTEVKFTRHSDRRRRVHGVRV